MRLSINMMRGALRALPYNGELGQELQIHTRSLRCTLASSGMNLVLPNLALFQKYR